MPPDNAELWRRIDDNRAHPERRRPRPPRPRRRTNECTDARLGDPLVDDDVRRYDAQREHAITDTAGGLPGVYDQEYRNQVRDDWLR
jgi:hypothetical protein